MSCPILASSRRREEMPQKRATNKLWESGGYGKTEEVNPTLTFSFLPPDAEEVERPCVLLLPLSEWSSTLFPPNQLVACSHPGCPLHLFSTRHGSTVYHIHILHHPSSRPSLPPIYSFNIGWIPWRFCAFGCFFSSIQNFHTFLILLLFSSRQNACQLMKPPLFLFTSLSLLSVFSLNIHHHRSTHLRVNAAESVCCCHLQFIPFYSIS